MRRTATLVVALPLALLTAGALAGPDGPDAPLAATAPAPVPPTVPAEPIEPAEPVAPAPPAVPEALVSEDAEDAAGSGSGAQSAPDAEGTVDTTDERDPGADRSGDDGPVESTFLIATVPDAGAVAGSGPRWRYTIEVEPQLDVDVEALAVEVRAALTDERSWARTRTLEQVDDPARARIRVVLASPDTVDELCGRAGLRTAGIYSCWNGRFAALNSWRWEVGADAFDDITTYRNYLVNHEFGHGLGYGHVGCPAEGAPAPVMMQQSKGVDACVANGWPYP